MSKPIVTIDFETYWDANHTLSKMSPIEYVLHAKTQIISAAIKIDDQETEVLFGEEEIAKRLTQFEDHTHFLNGHNMSGFDSMICAWRFNMKPYMWFCTLAMAQPIHNKTVGGSLKNLCEHYQLGVKDSTALPNTKGKRLEDFTTQEIKDMREYNKEDTDLCYKLLKTLMPFSSPSELKLIDMTIRMLVEPKFKLDIPMLEEALDNERAKKSESILQVAEVLGISADGAPEDELMERLKAVLASSAQTKKVFERLGVEVPLKPSQTATDEDGSPKMIPALAKTDEEFVAMLEHENPVVANLVAARLSVKSTILETRLEKLIDTGNLCGGKLPVPLKYCGAGTTGRWSGVMYNMQNLPRIGKDPAISDALRMSLCAPEGKKIIVADLSGIELRVNHFLWKVKSSMDLYNADPQADLYADSAMKRYGYADIKQVEKSQRHIEKIKALGLGFGAGAATFRRVAKTMGNIVLTDDEAKREVDDWREAYPDIVQGWWRCQKMLAQISQGNVEAIDPWGMCTTNREGILLPSGRMIYYPDLRKTINAQGREEWKYAHGRHTAYIYGGKMDENIVQALARDVIADIALEFKAQTQLNPPLMVHDELVYVVPEDYADSLLKLLQDIMRTPPKWWPELVTWSEGDSADRYGLAK